MRVRVSALDAVEIAQLEVVESEGAAVHQGAQVGFLCLECRQCDETLDQIWHDQACQYAGEHGRSHYRDPEPVVESYQERAVDALARRTIIKHLGTLEEYGLVGERARGGREGVVPAERVISATSSTLALALS